MIGAASPDFKIGSQGLKKLNIVGDVQTGKYVLGAWGFGTDVYFADNVSLLVGPVSPLAVSQEQSCWREENK